MNATSHITAIEKPLHVSACETLIMHNKSLETKPGADPKHLQDLFGMRWPTEIKMTGDYKYFICNLPMILDIKIFSIEQYANSEVLL